MKVGRIFSKRWTKPGSCAENGIPHPTYLYCVKCNVPVCVQHQALHVEKVHSKSEAQP